MTAAPKFTPGPWHVGDDGLIENESDWTIARCGSPFPFDTTNDERDANARLIAAAPRMFDRIAALAAEGDAESLAIVEVVNGRA